MPFLIKKTAGLPFVQTDLDGFTQELLSFRVRSGPGLAVHLLAAHGVSIAYKNQEFARTLQDSSVLLPDSRWLQFLSGGKRGGGLSQIRGVDLMRHILNETAGTGVGHFFLVPNRRVGAELSRTLAQDYANVKVAGIRVEEHRALSEVELRNLLETIEAWERPFVWVGNGTPAQNVLSQQLASRTSCTALAVGAAFDFLSGTQSEAPRWLAKSGMEWFFRLVSEPGRLWKRYTLGNLLFLMAIFRNSVDGEAPK